MKKISFAGTFIGVIFLFVLNANATTIVNSSPVTASFYIPLTPGA
ncbi:MAG: hypothetical protein R3B66_10210 [Candidatus Scalinduaceae bacterium]